MIKPYGKNIVVKPVEKEQIIVSNKKSLQEYGEVIAVGDEVKYVKKGDIIAYTVWGIKDFEYKGEKIYFVPEDDRFLLAKVEND